MRSIKHLFLWSLLACIFCLYATRATAQSCGCQFVVSLNATEWQFDGAIHNVQPGDTICLTSGLRTGIGFLNIHGTKEHPVVITNMCNGKVTLQAPDAWGNVVELDNCSNIHFTGAGNPAEEYGIVIKGAQMGINFHHFTTNVEADHLKIDTVGCVGIVAKTDPECDSNTWRGHFTMKNTRFHHNYINKTGCEGFYIGNSHYDGYGLVLNCNGQDSLWVKETDMDSVEVYDNYLVNIGNDGIQVGAATHAFIHNNTVLNYARNNGWGHTNGIQCGSGTTGALVISNSVSNGGYCFFDGGGGGTWLNNTGKNCKDGGFLLQDDPGGWAPTGFTIANNTLVNYGGVGADFYSLNPSPTHFVNNIVVGSPAQQNFYQFYNGSQNYWSASNNITTTNAGYLHLADTAAGDFHLLSASPAIDAGINTSSYGVVTDKDGVARPQGAAYDIGAYEHTTIDSVVTARFNFTNAAQGVPGWVELAGAPHAAVITGTDARSGFTASSISTAQWNPVNYGTLLSSYNGGVTNGTVQPAEVVNTNWFNYNAAYGSTINGVVQGDNIAITNLAPNKYYELHIGASRLSGQGQADQYGSTEYRFNGVNPQNLLVTDNATNEVVVTALSDATGRIGISARKIAGSDMNFGYAGWLVITGAVRTSNTARTSAAVTTTASQSRFALYPNPATNEIVLDLSAFNNQPVEVNIYSSLGALVKTQPLKGNSWQRVNTSYLPNGLYLISLKGNNKMMTTKLVIKK